jgi:hypothetical protein
MGVRLAIAENRRLAAGVASGLIVAAIGVAVWFNFSSGEMFHGPAGAKAFFTDDDGKTFFVDLASNIPPYQHNGKMAVGCSVFTSDHGKTKFVGWLTRFNDEGKRRYEELRQKKSNGLAPSPFECAEVKKPGAPETQWVKANLPAGIEIQRPPKAGGVFAEPVPAE